MSEPRPMTAAELRAKMRLPLFGSPLFIISNPKLVIAQCKAGVVGSFPALNARPQSLLDEWLHRIKEELAAHDRRHPDRPSAPFAVNLIVHKSNDRLEADAATCLKHKVPLLITSLGAREDIYTTFAKSGTLVFHDIINITFARKALEKGAGGLVAVCAGAGGHAGRLSPFGLIQEIREFYDGPLALSGAIAHGGSILAAEALGADFAYAGSMFIAASEANAVEGYKADIVAGTADGIVYTNLFTGVHGNYLRSSIARAGLDPDNLPVSDPSKMNFGTNRPARAWKDIWGSGQGIGAVKQIEPVAAMVERMEREYKAAKAAIARGARAPAGA
ncbi:MAG TPA: nitronate monooxygenase family protein [Hyphomicrobiaceae bacterium]|nr:nitronate monooxygenase family protein [Hyphomicrobiaceae bacterium]